MTAASTHCGVGRESERVSVVLRKEKRSQGRDYTTKNLSCALVSVPVFRGPAMKLDMVVVRNKHRGDIRRSFSRRR